MSSWFVAANSRNIQRAKCWRRSLEYVYCYFLYSHDLTVWFRAITVIPVATLAEKNANREDFQGANYLYVDNGRNRSVQSWLLLVNGWNFVPHNIPHNEFKFSYNGSSRNLINTESHIMWRFHDLIVLLFLEIWASDACCD